MIDLPKLLRIKADMIVMGEPIALHSDAELMKQAANQIEELKQLIKEAYKEGYKDGETFYYSIENANDVWVSSTSYNELDKLEQSE